MYSDMIAKREAEIEENRQVFQVLILHQLIWCVSGITKKARRYAPYVSADFLVRVTGLEPAHHSALEPNGWVTLLEEYYSIISESKSDSFPGSYTFDKTRNFNHVINIYHTITVYISAFSHPAA